MYLKDKFTKGECFACGEQDCSVLGYYADRFEDARGSFFLSTADSHPFCSNQYLFELQINSNSPKTTGEIWLNLEPTKAQPLLITEYLTTFRTIIKKLFLFNNLYSIPIVSIPNSHPTAL